MVFLRAALSQLLCELLLRLELLTELSRFDQRGLILSSTTHVLNSVINLGCRISSVHVINGVRNTATKLQVLGMFTLLGIHVGRVVL